METFEKREKADKFEIKSRLQKYWKKIQRAKEKITSRKAAAVASIMLTILSASADISNDPKELAEMFKENGKKQEYILSESPKPAELKKISKELDFLELNKKQEHNAAKEEPAENNFNIIKKDTSPKEENKNTEKNLKTTPEINSDKNKTKLSEFIKNISNTEKEIAIGKDQFNYLFRHTEAAEIETTPEKISNELNLLREISTTLEESYKAKLNKPLNLGIPERAISKIEQANETFERIIKREEKPESAHFKILENGKLSWKSIAEVFKGIPACLLLSDVVTISHEMGHFNATKKQGAMPKNIKINFFSGAGVSNISGKSKTKHPEAISAAGIQASNKLSDFIINGLREKNQNNQILAILALIARTDGFSYAAITKAGMADIPGNDLIDYSAETGTSVNEICLGLAADFIIDSQSWPLIKMAMGDETVKFSDNFWKFYYKLAEGSPEAGIKFGFKF